jgi:hypothetical protein
VSDFRVRVSLSSNLTAFSGRLREAREAVTVLGNRWALDTATWEPHDWSTFPKDDQ